MTNTLNFQVVGPSLKLGFVNGTGVGRLRQRHTVLTAPRHGGAVMQQQRH